MAVTLKSAMSEDVFSGISAVYAVSGGFAVTDGSVDISSADIIELPVSESSGISVNGGTPSTSVFRIHGLNAPWTSRMTPGDAEVSLQVPTYNNEVLNLLYGEDNSSDISVTLPSELTVSGSSSLSGKAFGFPEKSVNLGLLIINDTEDKALFVKKVKLMASPQFDGEDVPFAVNMSGTIASGADADAIAILEPSPYITSVLGYNASGPLTYVSGDIFGLHSGGLMNIVMSGEVSSDSVVGVSGVALDSARPESSASNITFSNVSVSGNVISCSGTTDSPPNGVFFVGSITVTIDGVSQTIQFEKMASDTLRSEQEILAITIGEYTFRSAEEVGSNSDFGTDPTRIIFTMGNESGGVDQPTEASFELNSGETVTLSTFGQSPGNRDVVLTGISSLLQLLDGSDPLIYCTLTTSTSSFEF